jgi:hypothetical protein
MVGIQDIPLTREIFLGLTERVTRHVRAWRMVSEGRRQRTGIRGHPAIRAAPAMARRVDVRVAEGGRGRSRLASAGAKRI